MNNSHQENHFITGVFKNHNDMEQAFNALTIKTFDRTQVVSQDGPSTLKEELGDSFPKPIKVEKNLNKPIFSPMVTTSEKGWLLGLGSSLTMLIFIIAAFSIIGLGSSTSEAYMVLGIFGPIGAIVGLIIGKKIKKIFDVAEIKQFKKGGKIIKIIAHDKQEINIAKIILEKNNAKKIRVHYA